MDQRGRRKESLAIEGGRSACMQLLACTSRRFARRAANPVPRHVVDSLHVNSILCHVLILSLGAAKLGVARPL